MSSPAAREAGAAARELGRRMSAAAALFVALVSLLQHAPLWLASVHGLATLLVLGFGPRLLAWTSGETEYAITLYTPTVTSTRPILAKVATRKKPSRGCA